MLPPIITDSTTEGNVSAVTSSNRRKRAKITTLSEAPILDNTNIVACNTRRSRAAPRAQSCEYSDSVY